MVQHRPWFGAFLGLGSQSSKFKSSTPFSFWQMTGLPDLSLSSFVMLRPPEHQPWRAVALIKWIMEMKLTGLCPQQIVAINVLRLWIPNVLAVSDSFPLQFPHSPTSSHPCCVSLPVPRHPASHRGLPWPPSSLPAPSYGRRPRPDCYQLLPSLLQLPNSAFLDIWIIQANKKLTNYFWN